MTPPQVFLGRWKRLVEITVFPLLATSPLSAPPGDQHREAKARSAHFHERFGMEAQPPGLESLTPPLR